MLFISGAPSMVVTIGDCVTCTMSIIPLGHSIPLVCAISMSKHESSKQRLTNQLVIKYNRIGEHLQNQSHGRHEQPPHSQLINKVPCVPLSTSRGGGIIKVQEGDGQYSLAINDPLSTFASPSQRT